ncbi:MAG: trimeric autotransporter adhesin [Candidatus Parcubacteria bacterium]|jgi:peptidoglycan hydrolase-like protein with peptidoglycan-binding domain
MNTFTKKLTGSIIALLLVGVTLPSSVALAATTADLQAQIQDLLAQIAVLQSKLGVTVPAVSTCKVINTDLTIGSRGSSVTDLQNFLISRGYNIKAGATGYFGGQTQQALAHFQAGQNVFPAVGYFGPLTRARMQNICAVVIAPKPTPTPTPTPTTTPIEKLSGEAYIDRFTVQDGNDTNLEEGDKNVSVMDVSFRVTDGDIRLNRFDLGFTPDAGNNEKQPWDTFGTISVWNGNKMIAQIDGSNRQNWKEDQPTNNSYLLRMTGLSTIIRENKEVALTVKVTAQNSVKGTDDGEIWNIFVPDNGIRALDASNAIVYAGDTADAVTLNLDQAGASDELIIRRSDADPDATAIQLKDNTHSGFTKIFAFDVDTDDSRNDIEIINLPIKLTVSTGTINTFVRDVRLVIDGKTYTHSTTIDGSAGTVTFELRSGELVINAGDKVTAIVEIDFKSLPTIYEGTTITGSAKGSNIEAFGADDLTGAQLAGSVSGETHTLYTKGTSIAGNNFTAEVTTVNGAANDYVTFSGTVNIEAFGQDVYIPMGTTGANYKLVDSSGVTIVASSTAVVTSSARESGNYFFIPEGSSETITLDVVYVPGISNTTARMQLISINYSDIAQTPDQTWLAAPSNNYRTPVKIIVN